MAELDLPIALLQLEERLQRVAYYINGEVGKPSAPERGLTVRQRMQQTKSQLDAVVARTSSAREVLSLLQGHPDLFAPPLKMTAMTSLEDRLGMVLASAPAYSETASRLSTMQDSPSPPLAASMQLVSLHDRLVQCVAKQSRQMLEIAELRKRSAHTLERWYEVGVLGRSARWADWEARLGDTERMIVRKERRQREED